VPPKEIILANTWPVMGKINGLLVGSLLVMTMLPESPTAAPELS